MQELCRQIQEQTRLMEKSLQDGRLRDFTKRISVRRALLEELLRIPGFVRAEHPWLDAVLHLNGQWRDRLSKEKNNLAEELRRTRRKRSSLGMVHKAYAGSSGGGNVVFRKG